MYFRKIGHTALLAVLPATAEAKVVNVNFGGT